MRASTHHLTLPLLLWFEHGASADDLRPGGVGMTDFLTLRVLGSLCFCSTTGKGFIQGSINQMKHYRSLRTYEDINTVGDLAGSSTKGGSSLPISQGMV